MNEFYITKRAKEITLTPTFALEQKAAAMRASGINVISLAAGEPDFDTPNPIKLAAIKAIKEGFTKYTAVAGIKELRDAVAKHQKIDHDLNYNGSQIVVCSGAKQAIYNALQVLVEENDEVIIPIPYWVSYPPMVKLAEAKPVFVKTLEEDNFKLQPKILEKAITKRTKVLILNSPNNPTGAVYTKKELEALVKVILAHKIIVISDEIYCSLAYSANHVSIASLGEKIQNHTIVIKGVSKCYAMTGWRIGYAAGPESIITKMVAIQSHSTSNAASISQKAALEALTGSQNVVKPIHKEFKMRRDFAFNMLCEIKNISCVKPDGAFYLFPNISKFNISSAKLAERILTEAHVAVIPGIEFGIEGYIRISYATSKANLKEALNRLIRFLNSIKN